MGTQMQVEQTKLAIIKNGRQGNWTRKCSQRVIIK